MGLITLSKEALHEEFIFKAVVISTLSSFLAFKSYYWFNNSRLDKLLKDKHDQLRRDRAALLESIPHNSNLKYLCELSTNEISLRIRSKEVKPYEVLRTFQRRTADLLYQNAVAEVILEANIQAQQLDTMNPTSSPLFGIPVSIKEEIPICNYEHPQGLVKRLGIKASQDALLIKILKSSGAIPFVTTSMPPLGRSFNASNAIYGEQRHPADNTRIAGGSSGGEGLLLLGGGSPLGFGSDLGGSVRIPAAYCGLTCLKPGSERISLKGMETGYRLSTTKIEVCYGPMARKVSSLVDAMRCIWVDQMFAEDPLVIPVPFNEQVFNETKALTIGYYTDFGGETTPSVVPSVRRAVLEAKHALEAEGHTCIEFKIPEPDVAVRLVYNALVTDGEKLVSSLFRGEPLPHDLKMMHIWSSLPKIVKRAAGWFLTYFISKPIGCYISGLTGCDTSSEILSLASEIGDYRRLFADSMAPFDALLGPVFPYPAQKADLPKMVTDTALPYTALYNLIDYPAGVVPVSKVTTEDVERCSSNGKCLFDRTMARMQLNSQGLPLCVQIIGRPLGEETVLRLLKQVEAQTNYWA